MDTAELRKKTADLLKLKDEKYPLIPDPESATNAEQISQLIDYWCQSVLEGEGENITPTMPYVYLRDDRIIGQLESLNQYDVRGADYFIHLNGRIKSETEILPEGDQFIALSAGISDLRTLPSNYIYNDEDPSIATSDKYNFLPRNFDKSQVASLQTGEIVKVRAKYQDEEGYRWYFVNGFGGVFGWVRADQLFLTEESRDINQMLTQLYGEKNAVMAYVDTESLQINEKGEVAKVPEVKARSGLTLGAKLYGVIEEKIFRSLIPIPTEKGPRLTEITIPLEYMHIGVKPIGPEIVNDFRKLLGNHYAWGGGAIWRRDSVNPLYGYQDCAGMIRQVLKMYGIDLPASGSAQERLGQVLLENKDEKKRRQPLTKEQLDAFVQSDFTPGLTFGGWPGHTAIVVSSKGEALRFLHSRFHRRKYRDKKKNDIFFTSQYDPTDLDEVVETDLRFINHEKFPNLPPEADYELVPTVFWKLDIE